MKTLVLIAFWIPMMMIPVWGRDLVQTPPSPAGPIGVCGLPVLPADTEDQLRALAKQHPARYQQLLQQEQSMALFNAVNVTQQKFWAYDMKKKEFYQVTATLRKSGNLTNIWVEDESWNQGYVTQAEVDAIYEALEIRSGARSLNPDLGIVEIDTLLFGQPPNKDGDGIIDFLILDIRDEFDPDQKNSQFIAGYFHPWDQTDNATSNKRDLLYLDAYPGIYFNDQRSTDKVLSTTAHELQHLIHYHYDPDEETWVNEGLSELAGIYCGYGLDFPYFYLQDTNKGLMNWSGEIADYARVSLWTLYIAEQFGIPFIHTLVQDKANGKKGYENTFIRLGLEEYTFDDVFKNWAIALYVNNRDIDPRYGYQHDLARGLRAEFRETVIQYPYQTQFAIQSYAPVYFRFRGADTLRIDFKGTPPDGYWIHQKNSTLTLDPLRFNRLEIPEFNPDDEFVLLLTNIDVMQEVSFQAFAPYSIQLVELKYDDGELDFGLTTDGIGANRFLTPASNMKLRQIRFYNLQSENQYRIYVYEEGVGGVPGRQLITPIDTLIVASRNWVEIALDPPLSFDRQNTPFFVGFQVLTPDRSLAYDHRDDGGGASFFNPGTGWRRLSDFRTSDGTNLTGYWMIRAVLDGGLVPSGQPSDFDTTLAEFKVTVSPSYYYNGLINELKFKFELNSPGRVEIAIYNILGQKVSELSQEFANKGRPSLIWDLKNQWGNIVPSGMYFYRATFRNRDTGKQVASTTGKVILLK
ncbi:MAG: hypothetical protein GXO78_14450 [Calditrichaeota bacterium]|nr:hypothetical protein [Calditrichota bacterium]